MDREETAGSKRVAVLDGWNAFHIKEYDDALQALGHPPLKRHGAPLDDADVCAVVIAAHPDDLCRQAEMALAAGKHVFCDKPVSITPKQMSRLWQLAAQNGVCLAFDYSFIDRPAFALAKRCFQSGMLGSVHFISIHNAHGAMLRGTLPARFLQPHAGVLHDIGVHPLYMALEMMGSPKHVLARFKRTAEGTVCDYSSLLEYPDAMVCCSASYRSPDSRFSIAVTGEKGRCHVEVRQGNIRYLDLPAGLSEKDLPQSAGTSPANTPFARWLSAICAGAGSENSQKELSLQFCALMQALQENL